MATRSIPPTGDRVQNVQDAINGLLDRGYQQATVRTLRAIVASIQRNPAIQKALEDLENEARRLEGENERLGPDNPVLKALVAELRPVLERNARRIEDTAPDVQAGAVGIAGETAPLSSTGLTLEQLQRVGVAWNRPNAEAIYRLIGYAESPAFQKSLERYAPGVLEIINNQAIQAITYGWGPRTTARKITQMVENLPQAWANAQMRTLQVTSYREATVQNRIANADILEYQVRLSALKPNTCVACIQLHGTILPIEQRIDDHNSGLCTSITKVKGLPPPNVTPGDEWFKQQSKERQRQHFQSGAAYRAWDAGDVTLQDFVGTYDNDIYGNQIVPRSLVDIMGTDASQHYQINQ